MSEYPKNLNEWLNQIEERTNRAEHVIPSDVAALCRIVRVAERLRHEPPLHVAETIYAVLNEVELKMTT
jgi:hypothetical protein